MKTKSGVMIALAATASALVFFSTIQSGVSLSKLAPAGLFGPVPTPSVSPSVSPRPSTTPSPSPPPLKPEFVLPADYKRSTTGCKFSGCPADEDHVYYFTPMRNRAKSYHRLIRTLQTDLTGGRRGGDPRCVCLAIGHFDKVTKGVPLEEALKVWDFDYHVLSLEADFSPAYAFEAVMEKVVLGPPEKSLVFRIDADMVVYPGFTAGVLKNTVLGAQTYAPVCWNQHHNETDWYEGNWRVTGSGMIGFYKKDALEMLPNGKFPLDEKNTYGEEDHRLMMAFHKQKPGYIVFRDCAHTLWHLWHRHSKWDHSVDGIVDLKESNGEFNPRLEWRLDLPKPDGAIYLQQNGDVYHRVCRGLKHSLYPG